MGKVNGIFVPIAFGCGIFLMLTEFLLMGQTQIDANSQIKNLIPIAAVERSQCVGSGTGWNCAGLQMYKITLTDGTILGPYVAIQATTQQSSLAVWQALPLTTPDPPLPTEEKLRKTITKAVVEAHEAGLPAARIVDIVRQIEPKK